ncbi:MAG TPA: SDR family NAD(P)-dependent oxidoreductase [Acetobacteraceae bacterium]|nr:SDR family NAD(P)-dependent oxidoreductase [Acetobacteraceae bacterium]
MATYSKPEDWAGRIVVVTGGSSGIGRAFVERLSTHGAHVIACGRNQAALDHLQAGQPQVEAVRCDISVRDNVLTLVAALRDRHGRLDVLINNAGVMERVDLLDDAVSDDAIEHEIAVNLTGTIVLTRRCLPLLRAGRDPMVVMITSGYALLPATRAPTYSATKAALHSFTMSLRRQVAPAGIRIVEVLPPLVDTPATRSVTGRKMPAPALVEAALRDIGRGRDESLPGQVGFLPVMMRIAPGYIARRVAQS